VEGESAKGGRKQDGGDKGKVLERDEIGEERTRVGGRVRSGELEGMGRGEDMADRERRKGYERCGGGIRRI